MTDAYRSLVLADAPLLYYPLDEASGNFVDLGSAGLTAVANGTGLLYQQPDVWNTADSVTLASANYIEIADDAALDTLTTALTVECIVRWTNESVASIMIGRWSGSTATLSWYISPSHIYTGRLMFSCYLNGVQKTVHDSRVRWTNDGLWHHCAGVYDGSYIRLYVDGFDVGGPAAATGSLLASTLPVRMGRLSDVNGWNYAGGLSHVAIYGTALSASTASRHAIEAVGRSIAPIKPKSYVQLHNRYFL